MIEIIKKYCGGTKIGEKEKGGADSESERQTLSTDQESNAVYSERSCYDPDACFYISAHAVSDLSQFLQL